MMQFGNVLVTLTVKLEYILPDFPMFMLLILNIKLLHEIMVNKSWQFYTVKIKSHQTNYWIWYVKIAPLKSADIFQENV